MKATLFIPFLLLFFTTTTFGQRPEPVKWSTKVEALDNNEFNLIFDAFIDKDWYLYSQHLDEGGPIPTTFDFSGNSDVQLLGKVQEIGEVVEAYEALFEMTVRKYKDQVRFKAKVKSSKSLTNLKVPLRYMSCNETACIPLKASFNLTLQAKPTPAPKKETPIPAKKEVEKEVKKTPDPPSPKPTPTPKPVTKKPELPKAEKITTKPPKAENTPKEEKVDEVSKADEVVTSKAEVIKQGPVGWQFETKNLGNNEFVLYFNVELDEDWQLYSQHIGDGGPMPTRFTFYPNKVITFLHDSPQEVSEYKEEGYDRISEMKVIKFSEAVTFHQRIKVTDPTAKVGGFIQYMPAHPTKNVPPKKIDFAFNLNEAVMDSANMPAVGLPGVDDKKSTLLYIAALLGILLLLVLGGLLLKRKNKTNL